MHAFSTCCLLLLASSLASIAAELQENTCLEAKPGRCESDRSGLIQSRLLVQKIQMHINERVWDEGSKNNQSVGIEPSLLEKKQELEHNSSDKSAIPARLTSEFKVADDSMPDWLKKFAEDLVTNTDPFLPATLLEKKQELEHNSPDKSAIPVRLTSEFEVAMLDWLKKLAEDFATNTDPFFSVRLGSELMVADNRWPAWLKDAAKNFAPNSEPLEKSLDNVIKGAGTFSADAVECDNAWKKANMTNKTAIVKLVQNGFACFATAVTKLTGLIKTASNSTVEFFKNSFLPKQALTTLVDEQEVATNGVDDFAATAIKVKEDMSGVNATAICAEVTKSFVSLEKSCLNFIKAVPNLNPLTVRGESVYLKTQTESLMERFPEELTQAVQKLFDTNVKAMKAILEKVSRALLDFRRRVVTALTGRVCSAIELPVLRAGAASQHFFGITALLCLSILPSLM